jgi:hypothetical protein
MSHELREASRVEASVGILHLSSIWRGRLLLGRTDDQGAATMTVTVSCMIFG